MFYKSTLELLRVDNIAKILRNLIYYIVTGKLSIIKNKTGVNVLSEKCFRFSKISVMLLLIMGAYTTPLILMYATGKCMRIGAVWRLGL